MTNPTSLPEGETAGTQGLGFGWTVGIVGSGLIGASLGLALRATGATVYLADRDPAHLDLALAMGAGEPWATGEPVDHCVLAVPPGAVGAVLAELQSRNLSPTYSDVSSVKTKPLLDAEALGCDLSTFVGGHPVAGRERGGATAALADLFVDRPWVICPPAEASAQARFDAERVASLAGAVVVSATSREHDEVLAALSHVPQLVSSALAATLLAIPDRDCLLAGQGVRDVTRLADSDAGLWAEIVIANRDAVVGALDAVLTTLVDVRTGLSAHEGGAVAVEALIRAGNAGRAKLPDKPGRAMGTWAWVAVVIPDRPGELAKMLTDVGLDGINVEDFSMEHGSAQPSGVVGLAVDPTLADRLLTTLAGRGWKAHRRS